MGQDPKALLDVLYERLNAPGLGPFAKGTNPDHPPVEIPPIFRKPTPTSGLGTSEAKDLERIYRIAPQLRGRAPSIRGGYGPLYIKDLLKAKDPELLSAVMPLSVQGMTGMDSGRIEINAFDFPETAVHEFQHLNDILAARKANKKHLPVSETEARADETDNIFHKVRKLLKFSPRNAILDQLDPQK